VDITEALWLDESHEFSQEELVELSGLTQADLLDLVECGAIAPSDAQAQRWSFSADRLVIARSASRLRSELDLDSHGLALVLSLLERIHGLESELGELRARLPRGFR
jgi:hypothetical protein